MTKLLILLVFSLNSYSAVAYPDPYTEMVVEGNGITGGKCIYVGQLYLHIKAAVSDNVYEVYATDSGQIVSRGLLTMHTVAFNSPGMAAQFNVRYVGEKALKLENGFTAKFALWEECTK